MLCTVVADQITKTDSTPTNSDLLLQKQLDELLVSIALKVSTNPDLWNVYANYYARIGEKTKVRYPTMSIHSD
jgi:hypothetical protein